MSENINVNNGNEDDRELEDTSLTEETKAESLQEQVESLGKISDELDTQTKKLQDVFSKEKKLSNMNKQQKMHLSEEYEKLSQMYDQLQESLTNAERSLKNKQGEIETMRLKIVKLETELESACTGKSEGFHKMKSELENARKENDSLQTEMKELKAKLASKSAETTALERRVKTLEHELQETKKTCEKLDYERETLEKDLETSVSEVSKMKVEIRETDTLENAITGMLNKQTFQEITMEVENLKKKLDESDKENQKFKMKNQNLVAQINALNEEVYNVSKELDEHLVETCKETTRTLTTTHSSPAIAKASTPSTKFFLTNTDYAGNAMLIALKKENKEMKLQFDDVKIEKDRLRQMVKDKEIEVAKLTKSLLENQAHMHGQRNSVNDNNKQMTRLTESLTSKTQEYKMAVQRIENLQHENKKLNAFLDCCIQAECEDGNEDLGSKLSVLRSQLEEERSEKVQVLERIRKYEEELESSRISSSTVPENNRYVDASKLRQIQEKNEKQVDHLEELVNKLRREKTALEITLKANEWIKPKDTKGAMSQSKSPSSRKVSQIGSPSSGTSTIKLTGNTPRNSPSSSDKSLSGGGMNGCSSTSGTSETEMLSKALSNYLLSSQSSSDQSLSKNGTGKPLQDKSGRATPITETDLVDEIQLSLRELESDGANLRHKLSECQVAVGELVTHLEEFHHMLTRGDQRMGNKRERVNVVIKKAGSVMGELQSTKKMFSMSESRRIRLEKLMKKREEHFQASVAMLKAMRCNGDSSDEKEADMKAEEKEAECESLRSQIELLQSQVDELLLAREENLIQLDKKEREMKEIKKAHKALMSLQKIKEEDSSTVDGECNNGAKRKKKRGSSRTSIVVSSTDPGGSDDTVTSSREKSGSSVSVAMLRKFREIINRNSQETITSVSGMFSELRLDINASLNYLTHEKGKLVGSPGTDCCHMAGEDFNDIAALKDLESVRHKIAGTQKYIKILVSSLEIEESKTRSLQAEIEQQATEMKDKEARVENSTKELRKRHYKALENETAMKMQINSLTLERDGAVAELQNVRGNLKTVEEEMQRKGREMKKLKEEYVHKVEELQRRYNFLHVEKEKLNREMIEIKDKEKGRDKEYKQMMFVIRNSKGFLKDLISNVHGMDEVLQKADEARQ